MVSQHDPWEILGGIAHHVLYPQLTTTMSQTHNLFSFQILFSVIPPKEMDPRTISINFEPKKSMGPRGTRFTGVEKSSIIEFSAQNHVWIDMASLPTKDILPTFNSLIHARAVKVKENSTAFMESLYKTLISIKGKYSKGSGRTRTKIILARKSIFATLDEIETHGDLENKLHDAQREIHHLKGE